MQRFALSLALVWAAGCRQYVDDTASTDPVDQDGDGYTADVDCDDADPAVHPDASELCNFVDDDCDGAVDEEASDAGTWYVDVDADGYGDDSRASVACVPPAGSTARGADCDDLDPLTWPGAPESCDEDVDRNCDGTSGYTDADNDGVPACEDCDDADDTSRPGAVEICDGADNDCDGETDEAGASGEQTFYADADADGFGDAAAATTTCAQPPGTATVAGDCNDASAAVNPGATELCNNLDDDCDGDADELASDAPTWYRDADADNFGDEAFPTVACIQPEGHAGSVGDCDDLDARTWPGAIEICDGRDNDCDGEVDETPQGIATWYPDADGDSFGLTSGSVERCEQPLGFVALDGDCDDTRANVYPRAPEICDGRDNDCDGDSDEAALDAPTWYADADNDGSGLLSSPVRACVQPSATSATPGDCDDNNALAAPGLDERCDGFDNDCDGQTDEADAVDAGLYYTDADADGIGRTSAPVRACLQPSGTSATPGDCDDDNPLAAPGLDERCDGFDNDCDTLTDEDDAVDAPTWYLDGDADGFGRANLSRRACAAPTGYVDNDDDCDDNRALSLPGGIERCNGHDDDCSGAVDEDTAVDATDWYADLDGDTYGDPNDSILACASRNGRVANDDDCDDTNAAVKPGVLDRRPNGVDDDCDGAIDEDRFGSGADGDVNVSGTLVLDTDLVPGRSQPLAVAFGVVSINGAGVRVDAAAAGLAPGDEVLVINLHGSAAQNASVGRYALSEVASVSGDLVTLVAPLTVVLGVGSNADLTGQSVVLQRVPQLRAVNVGAGARLTSSAWDGTAGGIVAFRATGTVSVASTGRIHADARGYAGGEGGPQNNCDAWQGESYAGQGVGAWNATVRCGSYNGVNGTNAWRRNRGGGGAHITGGGGAYGVAGQAGASWDGGSAQAPEGGAAYGVADLSTMFHGSGGGGVWWGLPGNIGPGGDGGGIVWMSVNNLSVTAGGAVAATGGSTPHWATGSWTYGAGGGAGGTVYVIAQSATLPANSILATGGGGEKTHIRHGGDGSVGRVRLDYGTLGGQAHGSGGATTAAAAAANPDPGFSSGL